MKQQRPSLYVPASTQDTAQFTSPPLRKFELRLDGKDRSLGEMIPTFEGDYLYFDRVDFPTLFSLVSNSNDVRTAEVARMGCIVRGPFKGIMFTHPLLTMSQPVPLAVRFVIGQRGSEIDIPISLSAFHAAGDSIFNATNTAIAQSFIIAIPPGARILQNLELSLTATTVTAATVQQQFYNAGGSVGTAIAPSYTNPEIPQFPFTGQPMISTLDAAANLGVTKFKLTAPLPLLCYGQVLAFSISGTGLASIASPVCVWQ